MNEIIRCEWCLSDPLLREYHDVEWGVPKTHDIDQFEHLVLETFQSGLSWLTILKKRNNFKRAFKNFDPALVAEFTTSDVSILLNDAGIIRNRLKIESAINNAQRFIEITTQYGSFFNYLLKFHNPEIKSPDSMSDIPSVTDQSTAIAKDLKKRGFKFLGPTTCYAHLQSVGLVNDHIKSCFRYLEIESLRAAVLS